MIEELEATGDYFGILLDFEQLADFDKSEISQRPLEISGQYLLLSYLTAALQSIGGYVTIASLVSAGEMDILAFYRNQRFLVETKVWYGQAYFDQGKAQLADYLQATGLPKGWLVIFVPHELFFEPLPMAKLQVELLYQGLS